MDLKMVFKATNKNLGNIKNKLDDLAHRNNSQFLVYALAISGAFCQFRRSLLERNIVLHCLRLKGASTSSPSVKSRLITDILDRIDKLVTTK